MHVLFRPASLLGRLQKQAFCYLVLFCFRSSILVLWGLSWTIYATILGVEKPYPSIGDVFWIGGYIPFAIGVYNYVQLLRPAISKRVFRIASISTLVIASAIFVPLIASAIYVEEEVLTMALNFAYPSLDLVLFSFAVLILHIFKMTELRGKMEIPWLLITFAILISTIGDALFSYITLQDFHWELPAHPLELFFYWANILLLLAFYIHTREL